MYLQALSINTLLTAKETAATVTKQFPLRLPKVKQIVASIRKHNQFLSTFTLAEFESTLYLVGGRHRLQALINILNEDGLVLEADATENVFPALIHEVECLADIALLTTFDNDSRAMPPAEKQYLGYTFDSQLEGDDYAISNISRLRTAYLHLSIKSNLLSTNTIRQIWSTVIGSLDKKARKLLTSNEDALSAFGTAFEQALPDAARISSTPARDYKKVAASLVASAVEVLQGFEVVHKQRLTAQDKEDVAILGAALERALSSDKIDTARGVVLLDTEDNSAPF